MKIDLGICEQAKRQRRYALAAFAVAALAAIATAAIHPLGYLGLGWDDEQYLAAARCWVAHGGPCLPQSHWWTRWPLVAPMAGFSRLLGESRFSIQLAPALWWMLALTMTGWLGTSWFGWRAGAIAVALLGTAPIVAFWALNPDIDIAELALQLSALATATAAYRRQSRWVAIASGMLAGMAMQARDTSILFVGVSALMWLTLPAGRRNVLLWALGGLAFVEAAEMLIYWAATGDPLLRWRLALGHTNIPCNQLPDGFRSDRGPLFNPDYIRSWKREMGITMWWPIDPWLNLIASPHCGPLLAGGAVAVAALGKRLSPEDRRAVGRLLCAALIVAIGLVYALAIDPKPRMFMSLYAAIALSAGAAIAQGWRKGSKLLPAMLVLIPAVTGLYVMNLYPTSARSEARSRQWIGRYGPDIELSPGARNYLALVEETHRLPEAGAGRRYLMTTSAAPCGTLVDSSHAVVDQIAEQYYLCLLEYRPARPSVVR